MINNEDETFHEKLIQVSYTDMIRDFCKYAFINFLYFNILVFRRFLTVKFFVRFLLWVSCQTLLFYFNLKTLDKIVLYNVSKNFNSQNKLALIQDHYIISDSLELLERNKLVFIYFNFVIYLGVYFVYQYFDCLFRCLIKTINDNRCKNNYRM